MTMPSSSIPKCGHPHLIQGAAANNSLGGVLAPIIPLGGRLPPIILLGGRLAPITAWVGILKGRVHKGRSPQGRGRHKV